MWCKLLDPANLLRTRSTQRLIEASFARLRSDCWASWLPCGRPSDAVCGLSSPFLQDSGVYSDIDSTFWWQGRVEEGVIALGAHIEQNHTRFLAFRLVLVEHGTVQQLSCGNTMKIRSDTHSSFPQAGQGMLEWARVGSEPRSVVTPGCSLQNAVRVSIREIWMEKRTL